MARHSKRVRTAFTHGAPRLSRSRSTWLHTGHMPPHLVVADAQQNPIGIGIAHVYSRTAQPCFTCHSPYCLAAITHGCDSCHGGNANGIYSTVCRRESSGSQGEREDLYVRGLPRGSHPLTEPLPCSCKVQRPVPGQGPCAGMTTFAFLVLTYQCPDFQLVIYSGIPGST